MENLTDLVRRKLDNKIKNSQPTALEAIKRLENDSRIARDFIVPVGGRTNNIYWKVKEDILNLDFMEMERKIHQHALSQTSERLGIPTVYLRKLAFGQPHEKELAVKILNSHSQWANPRRFLIRTVGEQVRGVLSDQYRRLNGNEIIRGYIEAAYAQGAVLLDGLYTDTKLYAETLYPEPIIFPTPKNGEVAIAFGARLSTSDYGDGALDLRFFYMQGVCLNGMVRETMMRQVHLGSKLPSDLRLSDKTYELDTRTTVSAIKDLTAQIFQPEQIKAKMEEIQNASAIEIDISKELRNLQKNGRLQKDEPEEIERILVAGKPEDGITGEGTLWKAVQGITAYAREVEPQRMRDLQEIAGDLMNRAKTTS